VGFMGLLVIRRTIGLLLLLAIINFAVLGVTFLFLGAKSLEDSLFLND